MMENPDGIVAKEEFWKAQFEQQKTSGLSQREYCRREGISFSRFHYWRVNGNGAGDESKKMVRVPVKLAEGSPAAVEVLVGGRFIVRVRLLNRYEDSAAWSLK